MSRRTAKVQKQETTTYDRQAFMGNLLIALNGRVRRSALASFRRRRTLKETREGPQSPFAADRITARSGWYHANREVSMIA